MTKPNEIVEKLIQEYTDHSENELGVEIVYTAKLSNLITQALHDYADQKLEESAKAVEAKKMNQTKPFDQNIFGHNGAIKDAAEIIRNHKRSQ